MRTRTRGGALVAGLAVLSACSLPTEPLLPPSPPDAAPFASVAAGSAGSVGKVLSTTCAGAPIAGSGFVVDPHHVLTAAHVVDGARQVSLRLSGGPPIPAEVVGIDPARDTALLRTPAELTGHPLRLADGGSTVPGTAVAALGYPLGDADVYTEVARITATTDRAVVNDHAMADLVTLDAALRAGSSGGPVVDTAGRVRGMVAAAIGGRGGRDSAATVALAIPTSSLAESVRDWREALPLVPAACPGETSPGTAPEPEVAGDAGDPELAHTLWLLGASMNHGQWGSGWGMLTADQRAREGDRAAWAAANAGDIWTRLDLHEASRDGDRATASGTVRTATDRGCREQVVTYRFGLVQGSWLVDGVSSDPPAECG